MTNEERKKVLLEYGEKAVQFVRTDSEEERVALRTRLREIEKNLGMTPTQIMEEISSVTLPKGI